MNSKVRDYLKTDFQIAFQNFLISMINIPAGVSKSNTAVIDHRLTNSFLNSDCFTGIVKTDISDPFPIFLISNKQILENMKNLNIRKKII